MIFETEAEVTLVCMLLAQHRAAALDRDGDVGWGSAGLTPAEVATILASTLRTAGMAHRSVGPDDVHRFVRVLNNQCSIEDWRRYVRHAVTAPFATLPRDVRAQLIPAYGGSASAVMREATDTPQPPPQTLIEI